MNAFVFSRAQILVLWWLLLIFNIINAVFLLTFAVMYFNFDDSTGILNFLTLDFMYSATTKYLETNHNFIAVGHVLLSMPFVYSIILMMASRVHHRKVAFNIVSAKQFTTEKKSRCGSQRISEWLSITTFKGKHFSTLVMVIETIEVALQTYQAHRNSKYIGNARVNQLYAVLIFVNCWSTSMIHYVWDHRRRQLMMARFLIVLADMVLDFAWGVVLQSLLLWPYIILFWSQKDAVDLLRVPETPDRELQQILVVSASNFVLNGFSFVSMAISSHRICRLLHASQITTNDAMPTKLGPSVDTVLGIIRPAETIRQVEASQVRRDNRDVDLTEVPSMRRVWVPYGMCMVLWGTGVLVVSIVASGVFWSPETSYSQCIDRLHPWFTNRVSCVGRAINCSELGIQGNKTDITSVLDTISPYLLGNLAFTDCPRLEIPSAIHNFSGIQTIAIHQSTLIEWNAEAAITNVTFPHLQSLQMLDSRVHCKPFGLTTHRFPSSFEWLRLKSTDVESFIHDVTDTWWSTHYFHCMKCGLRTLPRALDYIDDLMDLQVGNNSLTDIEVARLEHKAALRYLTVPWNPITTLPDEVWHLLDQLFYLDIQATNISTVTAAQAKYASSTVTIFAFGTPMCNGSVASEKLLPLVTCTEFAEVT